MVSAINHLSERQQAVLLESYSRITAERRRKTLFCLAAFFICLLLAGWTAQVRPVVLFDRIGVFTGYFDRILKLDTGARVWTDPADWFWGLKGWIGLLGDTLLIAYVGTLSGAALAFFACFFAAANLMPLGWVRFVVRRYLEICRTVPEIVFALIFVIAFGLGPLPGVLAIMIHTTGALGKLFAEIVENIDMKPVDGLTAAGASWVQKIRFAVLPQISSGFLSYALLRFEINVRGAAVMGFVGAGGIGQDLIVSIRKFYYSDVSAILLLLIVTVFFIDMATDRARRMLIGSERAS